MLCKICYSQNETKGTILSGRTFRLSLDEVWSLIESALIQQFKMLVPDWPKVQTPFERSLREWLNGIGP